MKSSFALVVTLLMAYVIVAIGCGGADDTDGDGWTDAQERKAGTALYKADTDGDGYPDPEDPNPLDASIPGTGSSPATPTAGSPPGPEVLPDLRVHFIDVGQGDAILIDLGELEVLIDGGKQTATVEEQLLSYLNRYVDGELEAMIVTHPHYDHVGGLSAVLDSFDVGRAVFQNGDTNESCDTCMTFLNKARVEGPGLDVLRRGQTVVVGNPSGTLTLRVLHPDVLSQNDMNNNSIVLMLSYGDVDFLFAGDAEAEAEAGMLAAGVVGEVEILKVGDHGSSSASSREFLNTCRPEVAIYMASGDSGYPHGNTLSALENAGADVYGTDVNGTIVVTTDGVDYAIRTETSD